MPKKYHVLGNRVTNFENPPDSAYLQTLTAIQRKIQKSKCPACKIGRLHKVTGDNEIMLWCNHCQASIDSDGGLIA